MIDSSRLALIYLGAIVTILALGAVILSCLRAPVPDQLWNALSVFGGALLLQMPAALRSKDEADK
ncbi:hypothetical protein [Gloeobacter kilaueensis]|uniref:Uncharacterized protein n=1 Tax=Gloeobacter kilaueensis (strain ATCC BAA-2537 / CCAP 1431/1 / ULC 316 / JS1) TaxID=1183438 RepID=U5QHQ6_GLOK1|nr:hypothetical protein [Gloeobacter kilaueensis]AGY57164.1 hypothetical protein GKIL_0918 [Gloeobacter kilaueensis JS1]